MTFRIYGTEASRKPGGLGESQGVVSIHQRQSRGLGKPRL